MKLVSSIHVYLSIKHLMYKLAMKDYRWTKLKPSKMLFYLFLLMIIKSNDMQTNPGPSNDSTRYLCDTCDQSVNWGHKGIVGETCDQWFHTDCQNVHLNTYEDLNNDSMISWHRIICDKPNYNTILFDLHSLNSLNPYASLYISGYNEPHPPRTPGIQENKPRQLHSSTPIHKKSRISAFTIPLRILNVSFQSIKTKQHLVNNMIDSTRPDIIFGTETWTLT